MKRSKDILPFLLFILLMAGYSDLSAKKEKLALPSGKTSVYRNTNKNKLKEISEGDSLLSMYERCIEFSGYDKKASANYESFFVTNNTADTLENLKIRIQYLTLGDRAFHTRDYSIKINLPPGSTRKADIKSWDTQKSYFYFRSAKPRSGGTPYKVAIKLIGCTSKSNS